MYNVKRIVSKNRIKKKKVYSNTSCNETNTISSRHSKFFVNKDNYAV